MRGADLVPPLWQLIGWTAAGGALTDHPALILAGTLFVWQIPHTWLLLCRYRDDLRRSGLPNLFETIPTRRLLLINNCWLAAVAVCYLLFPLFGHLRHALLLPGFAAGLPVLLASGLTTLFKRGRAEEHAASLFHLTNLSMALFLTSLIVDNLLP